MKQFTNIISLNAYNNPWGSDDHLHCLFLGKLKQCNQVIHQVRVFEYLRERKKKKRERDFILLGFVQCLGVHKSHEAFKMYVLSHVLPINIKIFLVADITN